MPPLRILKTPLHLYDTFLHLFSTSTTLFSTSTTLFSTSTTLLHRSQHLPATDKVFPACFSFNNVKPYFINRETGLFVHQFCSGAIEPVSLQGTNTFWPLQQFFTHLTGIRFLLEIVLDLNQHLFCSATLDSLLWPLCSSMTQRKWIQSWRWMMRIHFLLVLNAGCSPEPSLFGRQTCVFHISGF